MMYIAYGNIMVGKGREMKGQGEIFLKLEPNQGITLI
jgi:hypothetical protein